MMKRILIVILLMAQASALSCQEKPYYKLVQEAHARRSAYGPYLKDSSKLKTLLPKEEMIKKMEEIRESQWPYGRKKILEDYRNKVVVYASRDPEDSGEILIYYYLRNFRNSTMDSTFVVLNKVTCPEMAESLRNTEKKLKEWRKYAKRSGTGKHSGDLDVDFPEVQFYWRKNHAPYGYATYFPFYVWSGVGDWLNPEGATASDGSAMLEFNLLLPDFTMDEDYPVRVVLTDMNRKYMIKNLDYEKLKAAFFGFSY